MINLITILAAFFGGLLGRALAPDNRYHRMLAFIVLDLANTPGTLLSNCRSNPVSNPGVDCFATAVPSAAE